MSFSIGLGIILCADKTDGVITSMKVQGVFETTPKVLSKADVVRELKGGTILHTLYEEDGKQRLGPEVHVYEGSGKHFVRTDRNAIEEDNLGEIGSCF